MNGQPRAKDFHFKLNHQCPCRGIPAGTLVRLTPANLHHASQSTCDVIRRGANCLASKMSVPLCAFEVAVPEQLSHLGTRTTSAQIVGRERLPQIAQANIRKPRLMLDSLPHVLSVHEMLRRIES